MSGEDNNETGHQGSEGKVGAQSFESTELGLKGRELLRGKRLVYRRLQRKIVTHRGI